MSNRKSRQQKAPYSLLATFNITILLRR